MSRNNSGSAIGAGGPLVGSMTTKQPPMSAIVYQSHAETLAMRRAEFKQLLAGLARNLRPHAHTKRERSVCDELARGRSLSVEGLEIMCELVARSEKPFALEELIRGQVLRSLATPSRCPIDTFLDETRAQAQGDIAQGHFLVERTSTRRDAAIDALGRHWSALRVALDALHVWPTRQRVS